MILVTRKQNMKPIMILKTYFGYSEGQTLTQFNQEVKDLKTQCGSEEAYQAFVGEVAKELGETVTS